MQGLVQIKWITAAYESVFFQEVIQYKIDTVL